ncbi:hypothetical protein KC220_27820, partial [Mycobacterium tuberculosis]|nr:hypothetical protein [Mycobacterium tuberculosis]
VGAAQDVTALGVGVVDNHVEHRHRAQYGEFLTFRGGLDPVTGGLWLTDIIHHHLAPAIFFFMERVELGLQP